MNSAPRSFKLIYRRLKRTNADALLGTRDPYGNPKPHLNLCLIFEGELEPFYLGDWKSTGLKDRTAVKKRLNYLVELELILRIRQGHKILYIINPENDTLENWAPLLFGKIKAKKILRPPKQDIKDLERWTIEVLKTIAEPVAKAQIELGKALESEEDQKIIEQLVKLKPFTSYPELKSGIKSFPPLERIYYECHHILGLWNQYCNCMICPECLRERNKLSWTQEDPETGEISCPCEGCGFVVPTLRLTDREPLTPKTDWTLQHS